MSPVPSFSYKIGGEDGLSVDFMDRSSNVPTTWLWKFPGATPSEATTANATGVVFSSAGPYTITFSPGNEDGNPEVKYTILVGGKSGLGIAITQMIMVEAPESFTPNQMFLQTRIKYWQFFLSPMQPSITDIFNETQWPDEYNVLIAKLIIRDYILQAGRSFILNLSGSTGTTTKQVKRIETGPSNAEWYDMSSYWSNILKNGDMGLLPLLTEDVCMWADSLGIQFPFCPLRPPIILPFQVFYPSQARTYPDVSSQPTYYDRPVSNAYDQYNPGSLGQGWITVQW